MTYSETQDYLDDCTDFEIDPSSVKPMEYNPNDFRSSSNSSSESDDDILDVDRYL